MVDRYSSECTELCHFPNDKGDWVYYKDYQRIEAENEKLRIACASGWGEPTLINILRAELAAAKERERVLVDAIQFISEFTRNALAAVKEG